MHDTRQANAMSRRATSRATAENHDNEMGLQTPSLPLGAPGLPTRLSTPIRRRGAEVCPTSGEGGRASGRSGQWRPPEPTPPSGCAHKGHRGTGQAVAEQAARHALVQKRSQRSQRQTPATELKARGSGGHRSGSRQGWATIAVKPPCRRRPHHGVCRPPSSPPIARSPRRLGPAAGQSACLRGARNHPHPGPAPRPPAVDIPRRAQAAALAARGRSCARGSVPTCAQAAPPGEKRRSRRLRPNCTHGQRARALAAGPALGDEAAARRCHPTMS